MRLSSAPWMEARDVLVEQVGSLQVAQSLDWSLLNQIPSGRG